MLGSVAVEPPLLHRFKCSYCPRLGRRSILWELALVWIAGSLAAFAAARPIAISTNAAPVAAPVKQAAAGSADGRSASSTADAVAAAGSGNDSPAGDAATQTVPPVQTPPVGNLWQRLSFLLPLGLPLLCLASVRVISSLGCAAVGLLDSLMQAGLHHKKKLTSSAVRAGPWRSSTHYCPLGYHGRLVAEGASAARCRSGGGGLLPKGASEHCPGCIGSISAGSQPDRSHLLGAAPSASGNSLCVVLKRLGGRCWMSDRSD